MLGSAVKTAIEVSASAALVIGLPQPNEESILCIMDIVLEGTVK